MVELSFNKFRKYKAAPSKAKRAAHRAKERSEDRMIRSTCSCPQNMVRFSSLTQTQQEALVKKEITVRYKMTTGEHGAAKLIGFTFFPFAGSYPTLKQDKRKFCLDERKIFVSKKTVENLRKKKSK